MVCFVVLHYGDIQITKMCTDSILQLDKSEEIQIVIVDNDYQKSQQERILLERQYDGISNIDIVKATEDLGFSKANNIGYKFAKEKYNPDYIVVTNNDIEFIQKDFIKRLEDVYKVSSYDVLSPDVVCRESGQHQSPIDIQGRSIKQVNYTIRMNAICLKIFPIIYPLLQLNYDRTKLRNVDNEMMECASGIVPCGACIIVSKNFIEKEEKIFVPETHFYYEEYILYERCKRAGYRIVFDPKVQVLHGDGVATKGRTKNDKKKMHLVMEETLKSAKVYRELLREDVISDKFSVD